METGKPKRGVEGDASRWGSGRTTVVAVGVADGREVQWLVAGVNLGLGLFVGTIFLLLKENERVGCVIGSGGLGNPKSGPCFGQIEIDGWGNKMLIFFLF